MTKTIELLAPGGDVESIKAAILAGADAIYCGLNKFNARNRAENISFDQLNGILRLAHQHECQIFITLNIIIVESEIPDLVRLLNKLVNTSIDGVIIQDLGLFYILSNYFGSLKIHASTQLTTHNAGQIKFLHRLHAIRVNLSRELDCAEIRLLTASAHATGVLTEVFIHGSYCISFSGLCYMSSLHSGNSANRGRCSQPCRDQYDTTAQGIDFPLNLKDNSAFANIAELADAGVDSLKIEGRIKKFHYVYMAVRAYRQQLEKLYAGSPIATENADLYKIFNRDFSNGFLTGNISNTMFIENPRDNSSTHLARLNGGTSEAEIEQAELQLYQEKGAIRATIRSKTDALSIAQVPLSITISGHAGTPLKVAVQGEGIAFELLSESDLAPQGTMPLDMKMILKRFKAINDTEYVIGNIDLAHLQPPVYITFKALTAIKNRILFMLMNGREVHAEVQLSPLQKPNKTVDKPKLSVLISSAEDLQFCIETSADIYFQLPNSFQDRYEHFVQLFAENKNLIPWFPAVLLDHDFTTAIQFLRDIAPALIVTNNTGVAYEADTMGISWIAGPYMNSANSYTFKCLQENFNCTGAFVSTELNKTQIRNIKRPEHFSLHYSMYHPNILMTSRQCLFQQVTGCAKDSIDSECIATCRKTAELSDSKNSSFVVDKQSGEYNSVYSASNFMNTAIVSDMANTFASFLVDLRSIATHTSLSMDKAQLIAHFEQLIDGVPGTAQRIAQAIFPTNCDQYQKGI